MKELKFKKLHPNAVVPTRAYSNDAGLDLTAVSVEFNNEYQFWQYDTGLAVEIDPGFVGLAMARSSVSKTGLSLCNGAGVIDSAYRGPIKARFYKEVLSGIRSKEYPVGERVVQLLIVPIALPVPVEVEELSESDRGTGGFGSSNR
jgi:dUTP pyrophosphatase